MEIGDAYNAPFFIAYLLERLEDAQRPWWRKALARVGRWYRSHSAAATNAERGKQHRSVTVIDSADERDACTLAAR